MDPTGQILYTPLLIRNTDSINKKKKTMTIRTRKALGVRIPATPAALTSMFDSESTRAIVQEQGDLQITMLQQSVTAFT